MPRDTVLKLPPPKLRLICDIIDSQSPSAAQMPEEAECCDPTIRQFRSVYAAPTRIGQKQTVTPLMLEALCDHLLEKPGLYLDEMAFFLWDKFQTRLNPSSIRRAFVAKGQSKKLLDKKLGTKCRFARMLSA